ncbi:MAG: hypothetical protein Q7S87_02475 [Agitococcus sp.]|nr:hypothetical protein [Agitococcus sp.]
MTSVQTINSLAELEQDFGKPRKEWSLEQWKQAAVGNSILLDAANELINVLKDEVAVYKTDIALSNRYIRQLENRRIGAPRKPKLPLGALALYNKRKRGRPKKENADESALISYTNVDYARDLRHVVDSIKAKLNIKTDTDALAFLYRTVPLRKRTRAISYDAKLLSKHRKSIAIIE